MWNYFIMLYLLMCEGVVVEEGVFWQQEGEIWWCLIVSFLLDIDIYLFCQIFYVDVSGFLCCYDYVLEVVGYWVWVVYYCVDFVDVDGFVFLICWWVYLIGLGNCLLFFLILVLILLIDIWVEIDQVLLEVVVFCGC